MLDMRLVRPSWLGHRDENRTFEVYSLDVSADNARLVTGGLDSKVKVWSTAGVASPDDASQKRLLASMSAHTGAVTAVAFSPDGRFIASGSDDRIVLVSELDTSRPPRRREFGSSEGDDLEESEVWTPRKRLVGHENDVQDLSWSPDGQLLVSVGLDSAIIVWSASTFEKLKRLDWHQSHVKGVAFDPANKFFVTCSDDRTARVVRYSRASPTELSFSVEAVVSSPFTDSPLTSYYRRCSWSPDGESIACPNATNGPIPTVAIIDRGQWTSPKQRQISLVGHEGTTEAARFSPRVYGESTCVVATAGEDGAVAVWSTANPRPLAVLQNVAFKLVTDLAWSRSGLQLYASSLDGSVVLIEFSEAELGQVQPLDQTQRRLEKYSNATDLMDIPQSVEQVEVQASVTTKETKNEIKKSTEGISAQIQDPSHRSFNSSTEALSSLNDPAAAQPSTQASVHAPNEALISGSDSGSGSGTVSGSAAASGSNSGSGPDPDSHLKSDNNPGPTNGSSTPDKSARKQRISITKDGRKRVAPLLLNSSSLGSSSRPSSNALGSLGPSLGSLGSSSSAGVYDRPSQALPPGGISTLVIGNKRKSDDEPVPPKRHKEDLTYLRPVVLNPSTTVSQIRLATPRVVSHLSTDLNCSAVIEARNASRAGEPTRIALVARGQTAFFDFVPEYVSLLAGSVDTFWAAASETGVVYTYTPHGSRLLPPLVLGAAVSLLESNGQYLCALSATGMVFAWDILRKSALFPPQSIGPCLDTGMKFQENGLVKAPQVTQCWITSEGHLVLAVSTGSVFHYDASLHCWQRISESFWAYGSQYWDSTGLKHANTQIGPITQAELRTNEEALLKAGARGRQLQRQAVNRTVQAGYQGFEEAVSVAHLGTRFAAALALQSKELPKFAHQLVRKLAERGDRSRLGELFRSLPQHLLQPALDVAAEYKGVQTLVAEYRTSL